MRTAPPPFHAALGAIALVWFVALTCESSCNRFGADPNPLDKVCGLESVDCGGGWCCTQGEECGGAKAPWCPASYCCTVGEEHAVAKPTKQRRATDPSRAQ